MNSGQSSAPNKNDPRLLHAPDHESLKDSLTPLEIEAPGVKVFNLIRLNKGITFTNYICSQLYYLTLMFSFAMTDSLQPLILLSENYYEINYKHAGTTLSDLIVLQLIVKILVAILYGYFNDKFGRKIMIIYGAISFTIGCVLCPIPNSVFPGFLVAKIFISNGASALAVVPLNADYVNDESKGKAAGITITVFAAGAFLANIFLKTLFYLKFNLGECYFITGGIVIVIFSLICIGLKGGKYYLTRQNQLEGKGIRQDVKEAFQVFKQTPWLIVGVVLQTLGNSDFFIASVLLTLFIKSLFPVDVPEAHANIVLNNIQTMVFLPAMFSNILFGVYIDRSHKVIGGIYLALGGGTIAFLLISFVKTPYDWHLYLSAVLMGLTIPGIYVGANYLAIKYFPQDKRGIMYGMSMIIGYFGYVVVALGGGYLFDHWSKKGPFLIYAGFLVVALIIVQRIYSLKIKGIHEG